MSRTRPVILLDSDDDEEQKGADRDPKDSRDAKSFAQAPLDRRKQRRSRKRGREAMEGVPDVENSRKNLHEATDVGVNICTEGQLGKECVDRGGSAKRGSSGVVRQLSEERRSQVAGEAIKAIEGLTGNEKCFAEANDGPVAGQSTGGHSRPLQTINLTMDDDDDDSDCESDSGKSSANDDSTDDVLFIPARSAREAVKKQVSDKPARGEKKKKTSSKFRPKAKPRPKLSSGAKAKSAKRFSAVNTPAAANISAATNITAARVREASSENASASPSSRPSVAKKTPSCNILNQRPMLVSVGCGCKKAKCRQCKCCVPLHCRCNNCDCSRCTMYRRYERKRKYNQMMEAKERESAEREQERLFKEARKRMELRRQSSGTSIGTGPFWRSNDPYKRLKLQSDASPKDIRDRFKELARQWHPDKCSAAEAAEAFHAIREAYDVLTRF